GRVAPFQHFDHITQVQRCVHAPNLPGRTHTAKRAVNATAPYPHRETCRERGGVVPAPRNLAASCPHHETWQRRARTTKPAASTSPAPGPSSNHDSACRGGSRCDVLGNERTHRSGPIEPDPFKQTRRGEEWACEA